MCEDPCHLQKIPSTNAKSVHFDFFTEPLREDSSLFTTKSLGGPGAHMIDLRRMKM